MKFVYFLESLRNEDNNSDIDTIIEAYDILNENRLLKGAGVAALGALSLAGLHRAAVSDKRLHDAPNPYEEVFEETEDERVMEILFEKMNLALMSMGKSKIKNDIAKAIYREAVKQNIDISLAIAIASQESNGNPNAKSRVGAYGLFQLMPITAKELNVNPKDTLDNIHGGLKYYSKLRNVYNGNDSLALAAYNCGIGNLRKYNKDTLKKESMSEWEVPDFKETQGYVYTILEKFKPALDSVIDKRSEEIIKRDSSARSSSI